MKPALNQKAQSRETQKYPLPNTYGLIDFLPLHFCRLSKSRQGKGHRHKFGYFYSDIKQCHMFLVYYKPTKFYFVNNLSVSKQ